MCLIKVELNTECVPKGGIWPSPPPLKNYEGDSSPEMLKVFSY